MIDNHKLFRLQLDFYGSAKFYLSIIVNMEPFLNADDEQAGTFLFSSATSRFVSKNVDKTFISKKLMFYE